MARYILIDMHSGNIWGDTADLNGRAVDCASIIEAARALDESVGAHGRAYQEGSRADIRSGRDGYVVYRADIDGSEAVPVVQDGQDQETIDAVTRDCRYEGVVLVTDPAE